MAEDPKSLPYGEPDGRPVYPIPPPGEYYATAKWVKDYVRYALALDANTSGIVDSVVTTLNSVMKRKHGVTGQIAIFDENGQVYGAGATVGNLEKLGSLDDLLAKKVDVVEGMGLSTNDFTNEYKAKLDTLGGDLDLSDYATKEDLKGKVDVVKGKGLSSNDFTDSYKEKLDNLSDNIDLSDYATKEDLKGKVDVVWGKGLSANDFSDDFKRKLEELNPDSFVTVQNLVDKTVPGALGLGLSENNLSDELLANIEVLLGSGGSGGGTVDLSSYVTKTALTEALAGKVDVVEGKGLSTNDFTDAYKTIVTGIIDTYAQKTAVSAALATKVDKKTGYDLSQNNFTDALLVKLNSIPSGNLVSESMLSAYPTTEQVLQELAKKVSVRTGYDLSQCNFTPEFRAKLEGIDLSSYASREELNECVDSVSSKQDAPSGSNTDYGDTASASGSSTSVGYWAQSTSNGVAVGYSASAAPSGTAVGSLAMADDYGVALGRESSAPFKGVAVGSEAKASDYRVAVGYQAEATGEFPVVIGSSQYPDATIKVSTAGEMYIGSTKVGTGSSGEVGEQIDELRDLIDSKPSSEDITLALTSVAYTYNDSVKVDNSVADNYYEVGYDLRTVSGPTSFYNVTTLITPVAEGDTRVCVYVPGYVDGNSSLRQFRYTLRAASNGGLKISWYRSGTSIDVSLIEAFPGASQIVPGVNYWSLTEVAPDVFVINRTPADATSCVLRSPSGKAVKVEVNDNLELVVTEVN